MPTGITDDNFVRLKVVETTVTNAVEFDKQIIARIKSKFFPIVIKINEAPDLTLCQIFNRTLPVYVSELKKEYDLGDNDIMYETDNLIQDKDVGNIIINHDNRPFLHMTKTEHQPDKKMSKKFGLFVGSSRWPRLYIGSSLWNHYKDSSLITYNQSYFHEQPARIGIDDLMFRLNRTKNKSVLDELADFCKNLPLNPVANQFENNNGGYINFTEAYDLLRTYDDIFVDMVCETWHEGKTFLPTEKIARCFITKTPFIVYGSRGYLKNLKRLGFKTFDNFWSEKYDLYEGVSRIENILAVVKQIQSTDHFSLYDSMGDQLEHNLVRYKEMSADEIRKAFDDI
jgi:hypothetical protein